MSKVVITVEEKNKGVELTATGDMRAHAVAKDRDAAVLDATLWLEDWARREGDSH